MALSFPSELRLEFARKARLRREDEREALEAGKRAVRDERDEEAKKDREREEDFLLVAATVEDITQFTEQLDDYDAATVEALQENEEQMAKARERLNQMLKDAYTLPDGRKVFKSEDGLHVYDQNGIELKGIDPAIIEDWRPSSEDWKGQWQELKGLEDERDDLLKYQTELDNARKLADDGHLSKGELDDLEKRLKEDAPQSVADKLGGQMQSSEAAQANPQPEKLAQNFVPAGKLELPPI